MTTSHSYKLRYAAEIVKKPGPMHESEKKSAALVLQGSADRIEALEAQLAKATEVVEASGRKRKALEAKLAKSVTLLGEALSDLGAQEDQNINERGLEAIAFYEANIAAIKGEADDD